jgi:hypothetical protein
MSRAILDAPTTWPLSSRIGDTDNEIDSVLPSLRCLTVA